MKIEIFTAGGSTGFFLSAAKEKSGFHQFILTEWITPAGKFPAEFTFINSAIILHRYPEMLLVR